MNLRALASHTVDLDLLPDAPVVLDAGCRWFDFANAIFGARPKATVICLDPSPAVREEYATVYRLDAADLWCGPLPGTDQFRFCSEALVGCGRSEQWLANFSTGEGDFLADAPRHMVGWDIQPQWYEVECITIGELMLREAVNHFDLIKLDIEGSEFDVLENLSRPVASQISVEFHDWDKPRYRADTYYDRLWKMLPWYRVVQHEFSKQGTGVGHWDSLIVLRNA